MQQDRAEATTTQPLWANPRWPAALPVLLIATLALPWLNPIAGGPSALVQPWLAAATATLLAWHLVAPTVSRAQLGVAVLVAAVITAMGSAAPPVLLALGGLVVIAISAAVAASSRSRPWVANAIVNAWLLAALVSSAIAVVQYFGLSSHLAPWINPTEAGEAFANLRQRNQFATLSSIGLAALLWRAQQGMRLTWTLPAALLLVIANAASASRTGALQLAVLVALALWWSGRSSRATRVVCLVAVAGYAAAAIGLPLLLEQLAGVSAPNAFRRLIGSDGCSSRTILWGNVLHLIAQKPWLGWGWGELDYAHFATLYPGARFCDILDNAHNLPLHLAVELGVPAAAIACGVLAWWLLRGRPWGETDTLRQLAWSVLAVVLLHSMLEYPLWYGPFQMAFGLGVGLLAQQGRRPEGRDIGGLLHAGVSIALALALVYAAWDYHRVSQLYVISAQRSVLYRDRPLPRVGDSWLFRDQLAFAELSITPLTRENAAHMHALSMELLHYSPEPRVIETALESAMWSGREDHALWLLARFRAAFPADAAKAAVAAPAGGPALRH